MSIARQFHASSVESKPVIRQEKQTQVDKPQAKVAAVYTKSKAGKSAISIRLDTDIIEALKTTGSGWQTRINDALRQHLKL